MGDIEVDDNKETIIRNESRIPDEFDTIINIKSPTETPESNISQQQNLQSYRSIEV